MDVGDRVRLGIIGTGLVATSSHIPAALASPDVELTALVDPVIERAQAIVRAYGIAPTVAGTVAEVLDRIDAAVIASPNHTHLPVALECIAGGVSVLIEKPLAA